MLQDTPPELEKLPNKRTTSDSTQIIYAYRFFGRASEK